MAEHGTDFANETVTAVVQSVLSSARYRHISPALVSEIARQQLHAGRSQKEAVKQTKSKLHQVGGAYFSAAVDYPKALVALREAAASAGVESEQFRLVCRQLMAQHASTRERLPILERFYATTLANTLAAVSLSAGGRPAVVMDIACGFNPLAWPWMPFGPGVTYLAYDIYGDMIAFLQQFLELAGLEGRATMRDVVHDPPEEAADLALILKTLPCLEQLDKKAATRLLDALRARYLLVSFPAHSLGGRRKGMVENYERRFGQLLDGRGWTVERFEFATELAFLVETEYRR
jgi:16S rRNA (guanine(1405)-N(7))-methyltransferase